MLANVTAPPLELDEGAVVLVVSVCSPCPLVVEAVSDDEELDEVLESVGRLRVALRLVEIPVLAPVPPLTPVPMLTALVAVV